MATEQVSQPAVDEAKLGAFMEKALGNLSGTMTTIQCILGDRLGLFKDLAERGPATAENLATRAGVNERYATEWLRAMASAGYLEHDRGTGRFTLPPEQALVLAQEGGPMFFGGGFQMIPGLMAVLDDLTKAFRKGGGVKQDAYPDDLWEGMQRFSNGFYENFLVQQWIPAMPDAQKKLEDGALYADVGCGGGSALLKLAAAFPSSEFVGYDISKQQLKLAKVNAKEKGLDKRVRFEHKDISEGLPEQYDVISTFDVVHDAVDPQGLLTAIRQGLKDDGIYICLDINCADNPADNEGPLASMFYGFSVTYCMTTSLANDGAGLGTCGLPAAKVRELCENAGFSAVKRLELEDPFNNIYEIRA